MLKQYDANTARKTLLKRQPMDDMAVPASVQERITQMFGESLTPDQVVGRILRDVRDRGDAALIEWPSGWTSANHPTLPRPRMNYRPLSPL
jgi:histidinol dehydrogenase